MKVCTALLAAMALLAAYVNVSETAWAGDKKDDPVAKMPKPGAEHKMLAKLEGTFQAKVKTFFGKEPEESTGTLVRKMILDGRYLQENYQGKAGKTAFAGLGLIGYDLFKKRFVMIWADSLGTGIMYNEGTYDADAKTITYQYEEVNPENGKKITAKDVLKIISPDEQLFQMLRQEEGGKQVTMMSIRYTRKKA